MYKFYESEIFELYFPDCDGLFDAAAAHLTLLKAKLLVVK